MVWLYLTIFQETYVHAIFVHRQKSFGLKKIPSQYFSGRKVFQTQTFLEQFVWTIFLSSAYVVSPGPTSQNLFHCIYFFFFHSVSNFLDCTVYSVQSVVRALTPRELYSLRSTCVHTLNTNSANNTLRNKIGMSVGIAVVGI